MPCYAPLKGYARKGGGFTQSRTGGWVDRPLVVACGACIGCRGNTANHWALRCMHEAEMHDQSCFITLTYDSGNLPPGASLNTRDWQLFADRLRKRLGPFRYVQCGEYGTRNDRPHHHALIFGLDFSADRVPEADSQSGFPQWSSPTLTATWGKGTAMIGELTTASAAYTARYAMQAHPRDSEHYLLPEPIVDLETGEVMTHRQREFITMSRNPGIGASWFDKHRDQVFPRDEVIHNGHAVRPPDYYFRRLEDTDPKTFFKTRKTRATRAQGYFDRYPDEADPDRLLRKYSHAKSIHKRLQRDL